MHSNTRTLERDFGWHGVCIEANQHFWHKLVSWRRCCVVGAAVAEKRAEEGYHFYGPYAGCGGLVRSGTDNAGRKEVLRVQTVPLSEILQRFAVPRTIDFMSLDVEGAESLVMSGFPFETHTVSVLLIEVCPTLGEPSDPHPLTRLQQHCVATPATHPTCCHHHHHPPAAAAAQARSRGDARAPRLPLPLHERRQLGLRAGPGVAVGRLRARRRRRRQHAAQQLLPARARQPAVHGAVRDPPRERDADGERSDEEGSLNPLVLLLFCLSLYQEVIVLSHLQGKCAVLCKRPRVDDSVRSAPPRCHRRSELTSLRAPTWAPS